MQLKCSLRMICDNLQNVKAILHRSSVLLYCQTSGGAYDRQEESCLLNDQGVIALVLVIRKKN